MKITQNSHHYGFFFPNWSKPNQFLRLSYLYIHKKKTNNFVYEKVKKSIIIIQRLKKTMDKISKKNVRKKEKKNYLYTYSICS